MKRRVRWQGWVAAGTWVLALACGGELPAPRAPGEDAAAWFERAVAPVLAPRCGSCHDSRVDPPWYAALPLVRARVREDVERGRLHLDLSRPFPFRDPELRGEVGRRAHLFGLRAAVSDGSMPPLPYLLTHPLARLSRAQQQALRRFAEEALAEIHDDDPEAGAGPPSYRAARALLRDRCARCHNSSMPAEIHEGFDYAGDLRLLVEEEEYVVPGDPEESEIYEHVLPGAEEPMPPSPEDRLTDAEREVLRRWIAEGAPLP